MLYKGKRNRATGKRPGKRTPAPAPMRNVAAGLRLLAGGIIVLASLTLALYAGRVEAVSPGESGLPPTSLLAWLPWAALAFLVLFMLAWRAFHGRCSENDTTSAKLTGQASADMAVAYAQHTGKPTKDSTDDNETFSPEQFQSAVERHFLNCRKQSSYLALSIVAIDNFEPLADAIGQAAAGERLHQTALSLNSLVLGQGGVFAGPRTDERAHYLALLPNTDPDRALQVSEDIRMAVEDLGYDNPLPPHRTMTASLGLAVMVPDKRMPQKALFNAANQALMRSQQLGGNRVEVEMIDSRPDQ